MINLVTGGAGFLGSYLIEKLLEKKEKVICIDNLSTGNINNISHLFKNDSHDCTKCGVAADGSSAGSTQIYGFAQLSQNS